MGGESEVTEGVEVAESLEKRSENVTLAACFSSLVQAPTTVESHCAEDCFELGLEWP